MQAALGAEPRRGFGLGTRGEKAAELAPLAGHRVQVDPAGDLARLRGLGVREGHAAAAERGDPGPMAIWRRLSTSDHVYYMATKRASDAEVHDYFSPYPRPHDAYMNFMNALEARRARHERPRVEPTTPAGSPAQPRSTSSRKPGGRRGGRRRR